MSAGAGRLGIVSGAASGIGRAVAEHLVALGYRVVGLDLAVPVDAPGFEIVCGDVTDWDWVSGAVAAAVIAVIASFALLTGIYLNPDEALEFTMPWSELAVVLLVMPASGAAIAWFLTSTRRDHLTARTI